jgi:hypothetical protein
LEPGCGRKLLATPWSERVFIRSVVRRFTMTSTLKLMVTKVMTAGVVAGALLMAAPKKADAQVRIGVQIGAPVYPAYPVVQPGYGYYDRLRWEEARRAEIARREWQYREECRRREWERMHRHEAYRYGYGRGYGR